MGKKLALLLGGATFVVLTVVVGGYATLVVFSGTLPSPDEMPSAAELPLPDGLALVNGHCMGGSAGCYTGIQEFDVQDLRDPDSSSFACAEIANHLMSLGWKPSDAGDNRVPEVGWFYSNPAGTLAAKCEVWTIRMGEGGTWITLAWPGESKLVPYDS